MKIIVEVVEQFKEINAKNADRFAEEMLKLEESKIEEVVLNLKGIKSLTSLAIGAIYAAYEKMKTEGRRLRIVGPSDYVKRQLTITGEADDILEK